MNKTKNIYRPFFIQSLSLRPYLVDATVIEMLLNPAAGQSSMKLRPL